MNTLNTLLSHPAHLYIGPHETMREHVTEQVQKNLCPNQGCYTCKDCRAIAQGAHYSLLWLTTENYYTLDDVEKIHDTIRFETESSFFIIIEHAERLNAASANSLLKSLEEPPTGYHFMLLVERIDQLMPTIRSRCVVQVNDASSSQALAHPLLLFFTAATPADPLAFLQELESSAPSEQETATLMDALFMHWHSVYKKEVASSADGAKSKKILSLLTRALEKPPMPGSSKHFWKNLFLQFVAALKAQG